MVLKKWVKYREIILFIIDRRLNAILIRYLH